MSDVGMPTGPVLPPDLLGKAAGIEARRVSAGRQEDGAGALSEAEQRRKAVQAAKDFESILLYRMMEEMRRTIPESGLLETAGNDQVEGLFWFHLAQEVANQGGIGLWKQLAEQFVPSDGGSSEPSGTGVMR